MDVWRMDGAPHHGTAPFVARQGEGMTRSLRRTALVVVAAALLGWACDDNTTPTLPTDPTQPIETTTETFSGELTVNGARSFAFGTLAGTVAATLTSLGPDSTLAVGFSLGTWSGSVCNEILANDSALQGTTIIGTAGSISTLCVRIYDAAGTLTETLPFEITVVHP